MSFLRNVTILLGAALLSATLAAGFSGPARADDTADAKAQVNSLMAEAIATFGGKTLPYDELNAKLRGFIERYGDVALSSQDVLGRYWAKASPEEQSDFKTLVVDYAIGSWSSQLGQMPVSQTIEFTTSETTPEGRILLHSLSHTDDITPVDWLLVRAGDGRMVVLDVAVGGVSIVKTMNADFSTIIRANGYKVAPLLDTLRAKIASYKTAK